MSALSVRSLLLLALTSIAVRGFTVRRGLTYVCSECGRCFTFNSHLCYQRVHTGERPSECSECGKFSKQKSLLNTPENSKQRKALECSKCRKSFSFNVHYHQRIHVGERPYECSKYGKFLIGKCTFTLHQSSQQKKTHMSNFIVTCQDTGVKSVGAIYLN